MLRIIEQTVLSAAADPGRNTEPDPRIGAAAVLMDLALEGRVDTDSRLLIAINGRRTQEDLLDPILEEVIADPTGGSPELWIERLGKPGAEAIKVARKRLVQRKLVEEEDRTIRIAGFRIRRKNRTEALPSETLQALRAAVYTVGRKATDEIPESESLAIACIVSTGGWGAGFIGKERWDQCKGGIDALRGLDRIAQALHWVIAQG